MMRMIDAVGRAEEARDEADHEADGNAHHRGTDADQQRDPPAGHDAAERVAAVGVGAEQMRLGGRLAGATSRPCASGS